VGLKEVRNKNIKFVYQNKLYFIIIFDYTNFRFVRLQLYAGKIRVQMFFIEDGIVIAEASDE